MLPEIALVRKAVESLYDAECEIYTYGKTVADTHETHMVRKLIAKAPCRINVETAPAATTDGASPANVSQSITLIIAPELRIPEGSCIDVTFDGGEVRKYVSAGVTARYIHHQEIGLELREEHP